MAKGTRTFPIKLYSGVSVYTRRLPSLFLDWYASQDIRGRSFYNFDLVDRKQKYGRPWIVILFLIADIQND